MSLELFLEQASELLLVVDSEDHISVPPLDSIQLLLEVRLQA